MTTGHTKPLAEVGEDGRHVYTCPLCEAMCGIKVTVQDGRVLDRRVHERVTSPRTSRETTQDGGLRGGRTGRPQ